MAGRADIAGPAALERLVCADAVSEIVPCGVVIVYTPENRKTTSPGTIDSKVKMTVPTPRSSTIHASVTAIKISPDLVNVSVMA